jgi:hypothetical protein
VNHWTQGPAATGHNPDSASDDNWEQLLEFQSFGVSRDALRPLRTILAVARRSGCRTVIVEERYVDRDYRSEFSAFWSRRFDEKPALARRMHFFRAELGREHLHDLPAEHGYLGYCVLRPTALGPVGRTVLAPPPEAAEATLTAIVDRPTFFGQELPVRGVPFHQQDGEFLRCAHAAAWTCHYVAHHAGVVARRLTADIAQLPPAALSRFRPLPASGLTGEQLQALFTAIGIPAISYEVADLPAVPGSRRRGSPGGRDGAPPGRVFRGTREDYRQRILRVVCKYVNSGFPAVVLTENEHAFTIIGWDRRGEDIRLFACDDQVGPYEIVESPLEDSRGNWVGLMIPVPEKVFLTGEVAETRALGMLRAEPDLAEAEADEPVPDAADLVSGARPGGPVSIRSRLMEGRHYKRDLAGQGRDAEVVRVFRLAHLPHWVWVVEFHDRARRERGEPCVLAEVVLDSTSHDDLPAVNLLATTEVALDILEYSRLAGEDHDPAPAEVRRAVSAWQPIAARR